MADPIESLLECADSLFTLVTELLDMDQEFVETESVSTVANFSFGHSLGQLKDSFSDRIFLCRVNRTFAQSADSFFVAPIKNLTLPNSPSRSC